MIESIKRAIADLIKKYVADLSNSVYAAYPKKTAEFPCACLDVVSMAGDITLGAEMHSYLVRISIFANDRLELDKLADEVVNAFVLHSNELSSCYYSGISSISPTMLAYEDKDDIWRRDVDVKVLAVVSRSI